LRGELSECAMPKQVTVYVVDDEPIIVRTLVAILGEMLQVFSNIITNDD
jgi:hypothetical protein